MLKITSIFLFVLLLSSCKSDYDIYTDTDYVFQQLAEVPEIFVIVKREQGIYYKIIHFTVGCDLTYGSGVMPNRTIQVGYYISDGEGFAGYDFGHKYESLDKAISAAMSAGYSYVRQLGDEYQFQSGSLYSTSPFKRLNKR